MFYRRKIKYTYFIYFYYTISGRKITIKTLPGITRRRVCAAVLIRALKQKEKGTVLRFLSFGSPSWTRTNDPPGLRCPASACGNVLPCPLPTAAPSIAPFFSRSERSRSQQFTAMRLLSRVCAAVLIRALKQKEKGTVLRFLSFGSPSWTRTNDPAVNSRMLYRLSY